MPTEPSPARSRSEMVIEVPADMIDAAGLADRIGADPDLDALIASIRDYGQRVPVLLRHSPNHQGRYDVVYGRRRIAAIRALGGRVRALVQTLPDRDLIVAQGQENAARRDLSFVEKASFAGRMSARGFERKVICDALAVDRAVLSKMIKVFERVPPALIAAIGPAHQTGRDRWVAFADALTCEAEAFAAIEGVQDSDARFRAAHASTRAARPSATTSHAWGSVSRAGDCTTIRMTGDAQPFAAWVLAHLDTFHDRWQAERAST